ncbi:ImpA-related N-family protein [Salmonella enterica subsp. enterica serovar Sanjuan]|uniref:ImpA-related N-family protein n=1 Tax=Salmonella enterica subsp. enterica serovar Sanjuan TaxID=1160765 RepID=A0A3S4EXP8_SALET|nr:ImpA-related N-family protein [Salmonella enterica subsp. enterica serovar Sanjuan]
MSSARYPPPARLMRWPPESVRQQLADLEARGALPLAAFREAQESAERLQVWARETLGDLAPRFFTPAAVVGAAA